MTRNRTLNKPDEKRALRITEASERYGLSRSTIYKLIAAGRLRTVKIGGARRIPTDVMEALISEGN